MNKFLSVLISFFALSIPCFAVQNVELKNGCDYLFLSDKKVESIKSTNPEILLAQRVATYTGDDRQFVFSAKKVGKADLQIKTEQDLIYYSVEIKSDNVKTDNTFVELDVPGLSE